MSSDAFYHTPVLLQETLEYLLPLPGHIIVDCTAGGGGHSKALLSKILPGGKLIALDQDAASVETVRKVLEPLGTGNFFVFRTNFRNLKQVLESAAIKQVDGILFDLGVSSHQLDEAERGFSYQHDALLDMRMDQTAKITAADLVNKESREKLNRIIWEYGEERWAKRIAEFIVKEREVKPIETTGQLVEIIKKAIPKGARREGPHPAKRTFQALRIAVNQELEILEETLAQGVDLLKPEGRLAVITFHSLEDRIVKQLFKKLAQGCTCPPEFPVCVCQKKPLVKILTPKPVLPSKEEVNSNPRSRSAKLRVVQKTVLF